MAQSDREKEIRSLQDALAGKSAGDLNYDADYQRLAALAPELAARQANVFNSLDTGRKTAAYKDARAGRKLIEAGDFEDLGNLLNNRKESVTKIGGDSSHVDQALEWLNNGEYGKMHSAFGAAEQEGVEGDYLKDLRPKAEKRSSKVQELEQIIAMAEDPNATELARNSARRALGDLAKKSDTAAERIAANQELKDSLIEFEGKKAGAKEEKKLEQQLNFKAKIAESVKLAEIAAKEKGETLNDVSRMQATLPSLRKVVGNLKDLAPMVTSTMGGKLYDTARKELGFGSSKGANARAKYIAIVNNQILPLLKPTFGGAFTVAEGDKLAATLGNPDLSPEQIHGQLQAFIDQKVENLSIARSQLGQTNQPQADQNTINRNIQVDF